MHERFFSRHSEMETDMFLRTATLVAILLATHVAPALADETPATVRVYAPDCGRVGFADLDMFSDTGEYDGQPGSHVASCFLILHPNRDLLWDPGLGAPHAATPGREEVRPEWQSAV